MKNMIKMSLVAAVAVAGLTSTAAAQPLEDAIKNVDISGSVVYRYNDYNDEAATGTKSNNYKIGTTLKSKVNDNVTATIRVVTGTGITNNDANFAGLSTSNTPDLNPTVQVNQANFTVKTDVATIIAGKQGLTTPWTVAIDSDSNEQTGTGLLALIPAGPVTVAVAAFNQTNLNNVIGDGTEDIKTIGILGQAGPVAIDAWYLDMADTFDTYTIGAKANIEMVALEARYTSLKSEDKDAQGNKDNSLINVKASTTIEAVSAYVQYGKTNEEGGLTALDSDAKTSITGWNVNIHNKRDADLIRVGASMNVMPDLNVALNYATMEYKAAVADSTETDESELYTQITHTMGKNLVTYVRLGSYQKNESNDDINDALRGRLQVEYKF